MVVIPPSLGQSNILLTSTLTYIIFVGRGVNPNGIAITEGAKVNPEGGDAADIGEVETKGRGTGDKFFGIHRTPEETKIIYLFNGG